MSRRSVGLVSRGLPRDSSGTACRRALVGLAGALLIAAGDARAGVAQEAPRAERPAVTLHGQVFDSTRGTPLTGADVQLASVDTPDRAPLTAASDAEGRFTFGALPAGRYYVTFFHPRLDALGVEVATRVVTAPDPATIRLAVPSAARVVASLCPGIDGGAFVGQLLRAGPGGRRPVAGTVRATWVELRAEGKGLRVAHAARSATSTGAGWVALCGLPDEGDVNLVAIQGADTSGRVRVTIPKSGLGEGTLTVGSGPGTIRGRVVTVNGNPLAGASVRVAGSSREAQTDRAGAFSLDSVPGGSRELETRKIGYWPDRQVVDVGEGTPPVTVALSTTQSVLDTVKVVASRTNQVAADFLRRKQQLGAGHYFDDDDLQRMRPMETVDLLYRVPSVRIVPVFQNGEMRHYLYPLNGFGRGAMRCLPTVFVDGMQVKIEDLKDINYLAPIHRLTGVEIHSGSSVPAEYMSQTGCVTMLLWTEAVKPRKVMEAPASSR